MASSPWPLIHGEREALAAELASLTDEQWATALLCPGWTVRDVLGHMTATALDDLSGDGLAALRARMRGR
jgi:uncharacterized protein (TIGR03083 family)